MLENTVRYIACILLSFTLMAFGPSSGNGGPVDNMRQAEKHTSSENSSASGTSEADMTTEEPSEGTACCTDLDTCSKDSCDATKCSAGEVLAMPAVGLYAPLLEPQKPKMSKAKIKLKKKEKGAVAATKALNKP